jgi:PRC-barrel domain protein
MITRDQLSDLVGAEVADGTGDAIGTVGAVFLDEAGRPAWAAVRTGATGEGDALVPLRDGHLDGAVLVVPFDADRVRQAPRPGTHAHPSAEETERLCQHYGLAADVSGPGTPATAPDEPHGSVTGAAYDRPREALPPSQVEGVTRRTGAGADTGIRRLLHRYRPGRRDRSVPPGN